MAAQSGAAPSSVTQSFRDRRGFTLVELLVALIILGLSLGALFSIFGRATMAVRRGDADLMLTDEAASLLDRLGQDMPLRVGDQSGEFDNRHRWSVAIRPYQPASASRAALVAAVDVVVSVSAGSQSFSLHTIRLARRQAGE